MKYIAAQIIGIILTVLGGQGAIRLLSNQSDAGVLAALPGDISLKIGLYVAITTAGAFLVAWAYKKAHPASRA